MTKARRILAVCVVVIGTFVLGAATAAWRGWGQSTVSIKVENRSAQPIAALTVRYGTCGGKSYIEAGKLMPGQSRTIRYSVCGEGGYTLEARFQSGTVVKGGGGYVVPGSSMREVITERGVETDDDPYRL